MFWEEKIETMPRGDLQSLQLERLKQTVAHAANSPFYKGVFAGNKLDPSAIRTLDDIRRIPFTTKDDLRESWPYGLLAVSKDELVRMHSSSGTTGRATVIFHTAADLDAWTNLVGPLHVHDRDAQVRCLPEHDDLRSLHGGAGLPLRGREDRGLVDSRRRREQQAPDPAHAGFRDDGHPHHPQLCPAPLRGL